MRCLQVTGVGNFSRGALLTKTLRTLEGHEVDVDCILTTNIPIFRMSVALNALRASHGSDEIWVKPSACFKYLNHLDSRIQHSWHHPFQVALQLVPEELQSEESTKSPPEA